MLFITSDIKVLATITDEQGNSTTISVMFRTAKRGLFKEEMARQLLKQLQLTNKKIIKVRIH